MMSYSIPFLHRTLLTCPVVFGVLVIASCGGASENVGEPSTATAAPTTAVTTTTTAAPTTVPPPQSILGSTQTGDADRTLEIYVALFDGESEPVDDVPPGQLVLTLLDPLDEELHQEDFELDRRDLMAWETRSSGAQHVGFILEVPMSEIQRSFTGVVGVVHIRLDYGTLYFEYDFETYDLPEATDAEKSAAALERFSETSVDLSQITVATTRWLLTPLKAGCYTEFGSYGNTTDGIRIDFEISNLDDSIETYYDDMLLRTPGNFTVEPDYSSTLRGLDVIPGISEQGYIFFADLDCVLGEYRVVASTSWEMYLDEAFTLD